MTDLELMQCALAEARKAAALGEVPVGAVVARNGEVVAAAHNTRESGKNATQHAELMAIDAACRALGGWRLWQCELFVTLEPCPMCAAALCCAQIGRIVYGAADPKRGYSLFTPSLLHPKTEVTSGVLGDECSKIVTDYFKSKR